jgi:hypothetical protein
MGRSTAKDNKFTNYSRRLSIGLNYASYFFSWYSIPIMAPFPTTLKQLCTPAFVYFIISVIALVLVLFQNLGNKNSYNVGSFSCRVPNTTLVFIIKIIYVLFWTYILNLMCKDGHTGLSWLLVLLPFLLLFVMIGLLMINM